MPIVSMTDMLAEARQGAYAVLYCEAWNLESIQAVIDAAEEENSPIIAGFNGGFLACPERSRPENLAYYGSLARALHAASVPVSFLLNESAEIVQMELGLRSGFNALMVENEPFAREDYRVLVREVVAMAHFRGASVEAQVGRLAAGHDGSHPATEATDPDEARRFVGETGVDALGVSIGNTHILTRGKASIDLALLERIRRAVDVPLVLHGGTGLPHEVAREAIRLGVAKVNFGTLFKQAYLAALREGLAEYREGANPHPFIGMGGRQDIAAAGRLAVRRKVKELIGLYGSAGKALQPAASSCAPSS